MVTTTKVSSTHTARGSDCKPLYPATKDECAPACCNPCADKCPPKVRLHKYIRIKPAYAETCFEIGEDTCSKDVLVASMHCFSARIRRRGLCDVILYKTPQRATLDGKVCFAWDEPFWRLGDGNYEMEVFIDNRCCLTIGLTVVGCMQALIGYDHTNKDACSVIPPCAPQIEDTMVQAPNTCEECNA